MIKIGFTDWISSRVGSGRALEKEYKSLEPKEDTGQPVTDPNLQQQTAFIQETLKVFNRMEIIYSKLAELNINTQEKAKVLDEVRFAYSRLNEDALKQRLAAFNEMMAKVQKQAAYYSVGYSILKGHMPELVKAFESAKGHVKQKEVQAYTLLKGFREMIEKLPFDRFNQMQGEPANGNVCPESGWSQEVQRRFGDKRLADWLKTQETGWGKEGKTKVLELFDKRLKELSAETSEASTFYLRGVHLLHDFETSLQRFEKLREIVKKETYLHTTMTKENCLLVLVELDRLFKEEQKLEQASVALIGKRKQAIKQVMKSVSVWEQDWAKTKRGYYDARIFWEKHDDTVYLVLDTISLLGMVVMPPLGTVLFGGAIVARRLGIFARVLHYVHAGAEEMNLARDIKTVGLAWGARLLEVLKVSVPKVEEEFRAVGSMITQEATAMSGAK